MIRVTALSLGMVLFVPLLPQGCPPTASTDADYQTTERGTIATTAVATRSSAEVGHTVKLIATVSPDAEGATIHYAWLQTAGSGVRILDPIRPVASFTAPSLKEDQTLRFMVTTRNEAGAVGRAEVALEIAADPNYTEPTPGIGDYDDVTPGTSGPSAEAGTDRDVLPGDAVVLDASDSTGQGLTYRWRQLSGDSVELDSTETNQARFTAPDYDRAGENTYVFRIRITDNLDRTAIDEVTITVLDPADVGPRVKMVTTFGDIVVELLPDEAPITVENFLEYVDDGFYDNTIFHRVIAGFVVQGGGMLPNLTQKDTNDPIENESDNGLLNERGTVAMARTSDPDSATSQFYFNLADNDYLDYSNGEPGYTVFGRVFSGMDVVDSIATVRTETRDGYQDVPVQDILILSVTRMSSSDIQRKPGSPMGY